MSILCFEALEDLQREITEQEQVQNELDGEHLVLNELLKDGFAFGILPPENRAAGYEDVAERVWVVNVRVGYSGRFAQDINCGVSSLLPLNDTAPKDYWKDSSPKLVLPHTLDISVFGGQSIPTGKVSGNTSEGYGASSNVNTVYVPFVVISPLSGNSPVFTRTVTSNTLSANENITSCPGEGLGGGSSGITKSNQTVISDTTNVGPYRITTYLWYGSLARSKSSVYGIWEGWTGTAVTTFTCTLGSVTKTLVWTLSRGA